MKRTATIVGIVGVLLTCILLASGRLRGLLLNSAWLVLGTWLISLPLGTAIAVAIAKTSLPGRQFLERLFVAMLFVPLFVQATAWQAAVGQGGWLVPEGVNLLVGWGGAIWVHGVAAVPWVVLFVGVGLRHVPRELEEEALQDTSGPRVLWSVSLRHSVASVFAAAMWIAVICAGEIAVTDVFRIRTFAEEVYTTANLGSLQDVAAFTDLAPLASRDLWLGTLALLSVLLAALLLIANRIPGLSLASATVETNWRVETRRAAPTALVWLLAFVVVGVPLIGLAGKAGMEAFREEERVERIWSPAKALRLTASSPYEHRRELGWTLAIATAAATTATLLATWIAWLLRTNKLPAGTIACVLATGFAIPGPLLGIWVIKILNQPTDSWLAFLTWCYDHTILAPVLVQMIRALPLATLVLATQFATVSQDVLDSAASEGAGWWGRLWNIVLPSRWTAVVAAACMAFIVAAGDLAATLLVLPPGVSTISLRVFGLLHYGAADRVSALCLMLIVLIGSIATLAWTLLSKIRDE